MSKYYDQEIDRLHAKLAAIYRRGTLTPSEQIEVRGLWAQIERLEKTKMQIEIKEKQ